jgi:ribosome recycling factor
MNAAVTHFQAELGKIHTGRASPGLLEVVEVQAHNERLPLKAHGTVTARNATTLVVTPHNAKARDSLSISR